MGKKKDIPEGYWDSPLGVIPKGWEVKKLGEIGNVLSGLTYSPKDIAPNGVLVLRASNIQEGHLKLNDNVYVYVKSYCPVKEGDILICVRNGSRNLIGKSAIVSKEVTGMAFGAFMTVFRSELNSYIFHLLKTDFYNRQVYLNLGATINSINGNDLRNFQFPLPSEKEQEKISRILNLWDKAICIQSNLIEKLELRKKGLMQQLLTGKKRLKGFKDEWNIVKIEDFANEYIELNKQKEELTVLSCTKYRGLVSSLEYFGKQVYSEDRRHYKIVPIYSFAYATNHIEEGSIGYQTGYDKALISPMYTVFTTSERVNNNFLYLLLKTHQYIAEYRKRMEGSIDRRGGLRWNSFSKIKIALPPLTEQKAIAEILSSADQEIVLAKQKLEFFKTQKKGLMQQLLTGKTRVKPV